MPHNSYLLKKYETYINIEIYALIKFVFYLYKYTYKESDRVDIVVAYKSYRSYGDNLISDNPQSNSRPCASNKLIDEITKYHSAR